MGSRRNKVSRVLAYWVAAGNERGEQGQFGGWGRGYVLNMMKGIQGGRRGSPGIKSERDGSSAKAQRSIDL